MKPTKFIPTWLKNTLNRDLIGAPISLDMLLKFKGMNGDEEACILHDDGSLHDFIFENMIYALQLESKTSASYKVKTLI